MLLYLFIHFFKTKIVNDNVKNTKSPVSIKWVAKNNYKFLHCTTVLHLSNTSIFNPSKFRCRKKTEKFVVRSLVDFLFFSIAVEHGKMSGFFQFLVRNKIIFPLLR
jgi:hypothetical protein